MMTPKDREAPPEVCNMDRPSVTLMTPTWMSNGDGRDHLPVAHNDGSYFILEQGYKNVPPHGCVFIILINGLR